MNSLVEFKVISTVETALKKLNKVNIATYKLKKRGASVYFSVEEEYTQKVFAIFAHPCYNICIRRKSAKTRFLQFFGRRFGLIAGVLAFLAICIISNGLVLAVKVVGNGSYLSPQVLDAAQSCGVCYFSPCASLDKPLLQSKILSLPSVTFCSVQRRGSILVIEVRTDEEHSSQLNAQSLVCQTEGEVYRITALSGTAEKCVGDKVQVGETLIGAYRLTESGEKQSCIAVGFAEIKRTASVVVFFGQESEANERAALSSASLYSDKVLEKSCKVSPCEGGVNYNVTFTYLTTVAINME